MVDLTCLHVYKKRNAHCIDSVYVLVRLVPVSKRTDNWPDGRQSVRFGQCLVYGLVKIH